MILKILTRISRRYSSKDEQDGMSDLSTITREHCPTDKARAIVDKDDVIDCSYLQRSFGKFGLKFFFFSFCLLWHYSLSAQETSQEKKDQEVSQKIFTLKFQPPQGKSYQSSHQLDLTITLPNFQKAKDTGELELTTGNLEYKVNTLQHIRESNSRICTQNKFQSFDLKLNIPNQVNKNISKQNLAEYPDLSQILSNIEKLPLIFSPQGELLEVGGLEQLSFQGMSSQGVSQTFQLMNDYYLFPDRPVSIGDSWNLTQTFGENNSNTPFTIQKQNTITLAKIENNTAMLDENVVLELTVNMPNPNPSPFQALLFTIIGNGTAIVEQSTGWLLEKEMHFESQAKGKMQGIEIPLPINITGTYNSKNEK